MVNGNNQLLFTHEQGEFDEDTTSARPKLKPAWHA